MSATPEPASLRVLVTNRILTSRTGTEIYVRDLARSLSARGHRPVVYSPLLGDVASEIRAATIPVTSDLASISEPPDVIHGHHGLETLAALLAFPATPALAFCHSWIGWADALPQFPRILRYVAVDRTCRDRLSQELGIPADRIRLLLNAVDLERFHPRPPLPPRPRRALVFSNAAGAAGSHLDAIRAACAAEAIEVEVMGASSGRSHAHPEEALGQFDLVFAKGKAALEALATGNAVILCDMIGMGPMVATGNLGNLRPLNFGMRTLSGGVTAEALRREIARYDAADAAAVSREIRATAGQEALVDQLCALYREVRAEHAVRTTDPRAELRAAAAYLQWLAPRLYERDLLRGVLQRMLRTPVLGRMLRSLGSRAASGHWLPQLLRMQSGD